MKTVLSIDQEDDLSNDVRLEQNQLPKPRLKSFTESNSTSKTMSKTQSTLTTTTSKKIQVSILHSSSYTQILYEQMKFIHNDRDILLANLLHYCGFIKQRPSFFHVVKPMKATRDDLELFHTCDYLDLIQYCSSSNGNSSSGDVHSVLERYGLVDDCPLPAPSSSNYDNHNYTSHGANNNICFDHDNYDEQHVNENHLLWTYCLSITGASIHAMKLLLQNKTDVAINFGGGRHHAHPSKAGGFCYVNDIVLAIKYVLNRMKPKNYTYTTPNIITHNIPTSSMTNTPKGKVLYLDLDIHHSDGVQSAFYNTDQVLTISLHRYTPGFFPCTSGSINEKGKYKTQGVGYNLNIPMPRFCKDIDFVQMVQRILKYILPEYDPDIVVVCVGADGLRGDDLVKETFEGWDLTPEGLAECVRLIALECAGVGVGGKTNINSNKNTRRRKLLILGGGGYNASNTARTFLLCTAAACEGSRPGMIHELPKDVPQHKYFSRYGPSFQLYSQRHFDELRRALPSGVSSADNDAESSKNNIFCREDEYSLTLKKGMEAIHLTYFFLKNRTIDLDGTNLNQEFCSLDNIENCWSNSTNYKSKNIHHHSRRRKKISKNL